MPRQEPKKSRKKILNTDILIEDQQQKKTEEIPYRSLMLRKAEAIELLNGTQMPSKFRFREREIERIEAFLNACINQNKKSFRFLMLTGSPGAGKSLCANTLLAKYGCRVIKLNANIVKSLQEIQQTLADKLLGDDKNGSRTASSIIVELEKAQFNQTCVIYIEEIELLFKSDPNPTTEDFMLLFQKKGLKLILIGISNTIDTLMKASNKFGFKISEVENIIFPPYTAENIGEIMKDKIGQVRKKTELQIDFPETLLKWASRKLEGMKKGDFRVCLEFLKCLVQLVMDKTPEPAQTFKIESANVGEIFSKMNISKNSIIDNLPYQQKVMLIAIYTQFKQTDALYVTPRQLQKRVKWVCDSLQITYTRQLMSDGLSELHQYSLIDLKNKSDGQVILLKTGLQDIEAAFYDSFIFKRFFINT